MDHSFDSYTVIDSHTPASTGSGLVGLLLELVFKPFRLETLELPRFRAETLELPWFRA